VKKLVLMLVPLFLYSQSLSELLESADKKSSHIISKELSLKSKKQELNSKESLNLPTLDVGAFYQRSDEANPFSPGTTMSAYAKVGYDIYTGGKNSSVIKQKNLELNSAKFELESTKRDVELQIVQLFFNAKTLEASLLAQKSSLESLSLQLERVKGFLKASLATQDDVDRLQSAYDQKLYAIESLKFQILELKKRLSLNCGEEVTSLEASEFKKVDEKAEELSSIKSMRESASSLVEMANQVDSFYLPQIRVEDTYSFYGYMDKPTFAGQEIELLDNQNKLMLTLNMRLYDFGVMSKAKEAVLTKALALKTEVEFKVKEQKMQQELAQERIKSAKIQIKSAKSSLKSATSAFETITKKFNANIVDNVTYLDALSRVTQAKSMYEASLNNLELAYALYYYYNSKKLGEYIK